MGKPQELQLHIIVQEVKEENSPQYLNGKKLTSPEPRNYKWWISIIMYAFFVLFGQSASTLLGRLYYDKGGKSIWVATLAQLAGFPILIPCYCLSPPRSCTTNEQTKQPSALILAIIYFSFGICLAAYSLMYSFGLLYLPVSTFSLICASQLAFTALFSFFLHSQKFTPFIINSLVLLTISSTLLIFQTDPASHAEVSKGKYAIGFICTIGASAGYGLMLSLTQLAFKKLLKRETHAKVFEMVIYQSLIATSVAIVGLFISGEWKNLSVEMEEFRLGKFSYVMTLIETAIASEFFVVGAIGLIFEVSSLFSNAISVLGLPVIPILAVIFFHEKMDPIKVIAMVLAIWGFVSYVYQCYLDNTSSKSEYRSGSEVSKSPLLEEVS
ncbi:PREDICTED: probable purine permease 9 [Theobroma cacao]|uniref:Probable purine permease n=2 Tax=Theobroma cacao TaxID=3641 RepID=A0A061GD42_THECC|nr:PREDICTED: probable purine permease 9 [Theobroma cacao]EOY27774.1 Purine permease 10 isoform 1 [Theobroma cacao]EOY27775.1 Purine permease 10 isoform 1 [Theobroma cacao]